MTEQISRRNFLKLAGITAGALGVTVCGGTALAAAYHPPFDKPAEQCMADKQTDRILVAYATKAGSTGEVAARMAEILGKRAMCVDLMPLEAVKNLTPYRSVVLGSAIRTGNVLPEVNDFLKKNRDALQDKVFNMFIVCLTLHEDTPENRAKASSFLDPVREVVKPAAEGMFAGKVDLNKLGLLDRLMANAVKAPVGDFRKWDEIQSWAESLAV